ILAWSLFSLPHFFFSLHGLFLFPAVVAVRILLLPPAGTDQLAVFDSPANHLADDTAIPAGGGLDVVLHPHLRADCLHDRLARLGKPSLLRRSPERHAPRLLVENDHALWQILALALDRFRRPHPVTVALQHERSVHGRPDGRRAQDGVDGVANVGLLG